MILTPQEKPKGRYNFPKVRIKDNHSNIYKAVRLDYLYNKDWIVYIVPDKKKYLFNPILATTLPPKEKNIAIEVKRVIAKEPHDLKLFMGLLTLKTELALLKGLQPKFFIPYDTLKEQNSLYTKIKNLYQRFI